jgi:hypothetical protein
VLTAVLMAIAVSFIWLLADNKMKRSGKAQDAAIARTRHRWEAII